MLRLCRLTKPLIDRSASKLTKKLKNLRLLKSEPLTDKLSKSELFSNSNHKLNSKSMRNQCSGESYLALKLYLLI